jgi:hypothetical protein
VTLAARPRRRGQCNSRVTERGSRGSLSEVLILPVNDARGFRLSGF